MKRPRPKIVVIAGGTGAMATLSGLVYLGGKSRFDITAVVGMGDSGGSSGRLRDELGVLPPGDVLKALLALSTKIYARELLQFRFQATGLAKFDRHTAGNLLLTMMFLYSGDYIAAIRAMETLLDCQGRILPAYLDDVTLVAQTSNSQEIRGEGKIEEWIYDLKFLNATVSQVHLQPTPCLLNEAREAIDDADLVVVGPGSFYTSLEAVLQVEGMREALLHKRLVYVVNLTTYPKETPGWKASTFVHELEEQIHRKFDTVICNTGFSEALQYKYGKEKSAIVELDIPRAWNGREVITANFVPEGAVLARHEPVRLANIIATLA